MDVYYVVYSDLTVLEGRDDVDVPARGVQVIVQTHPDVGWHTQCQYDFYIRRDGRFVGVDRAGLFDDLEELGLARFNIGLTHQVKHQGEWAEVDEFGLYKWLEENNLCLFGRTLTTKKFYQAMTTALGIRRVEIEKTGWLPGEVRPNG